MGALKQKTVHEFQVVRSVIKELNSENFARLKVQLSTGCFALAGTLAQVPEHLKVTAVEWSPHGHLVVFAKERK